MKKYLIAGFLGITAISASAQKLKEEDVPGIVKNAFTNQYPGLKAKWEKEDGNYEAAFKKDSKAMTVVYDPMGALKETEVAIKQFELPPSVLDYLNSNYKGKKIKETAKITKADGTINYEAEIDGKDIVFDSNGNLIKGSKD
jgi:hypothetical protein